MTDLRQTLKYAEYMKTLGWNALQLNNELGIRNYVYVRKIPLVGNIAKLQRPSAMPAPEVMESLHRKYTLATIYIEPLIHKLPRAESPRFSCILSFQALRHLMQRNLETFLRLRPRSESPGFWRSGYNSSFLIPGLRVAKNCFLPPKTIHIDLTQSEKVIFNQMKSKTRYNTRVAQKRGVKVLPSQDITTFIKLWHRSARHRGFFFSQEKEIKALWGAFGKKAYLLLAFSDPKQPLAGVLIARSATTAYYMYAASTREGNKLSAPTLLVWEAVKLAKKAGCKIFDFEGIYDERYPQTKSWKGFSRFKESFGGKVIEYPKTLVKYYNPLLQLLKL